MIITFHSRRLVEVDTPLSPQRDLVASFNDVESMRIKANGPGSAPDAISSGASSTQPKASAEAPAATAPPTLPMFWSFTEPSEFFKRHPTGQNSRTLPDLKVGLKPKRRRRLPEIPKNRKRTYPDNIDRTFEGKYARDEQN